MTVRLGYSYWGFLGDNKLDAEGHGLSTPDGNATYSWSIIHEAQKRYWTVYNMQQDRDWPAVGSFGPDNFSAFSCDDRWKAYIQLHDAWEDPETRFPELDVLLLEWRFPIPGRNCLEVATDGGVCFNGQEPQPDLKRQYDLLDHYRSKQTKIILWDLDHKLTMQDEQWIDPHAIFETSHTPRELTSKRTKVEFPTVVANLLEHPTLHHDTSRKLVYIGSRYERDDVIEEYLKPLSDLWPEQIEFWGNWTREPNLSECRAMWPNISYHRRLTTKDFRRVYGTAVACPILAKRSYIETGFITPRPYEALMFGTIPIGLSQMKGIENYVIHHGRDWRELREIVDHLDQLDWKARNQLRKKNIELIEHVDARYFVDKIQEVLDASASVL